MADAKYYQCSVDSDKDLEVWSRGGAIRFCSDGDVVLDLAQLKLLSRQIRKHIKQLGENK